MTNQVRKSTRSDNVILIPTDFSSVADLAIVHGLELAQRIHGRVCLLHVYDNKTGTIGHTGDAGYQSILQDLLKCKERCEQKYTINIALLIREGNLFNVVNKVVSEIKPRLMVMGTHGKQGLQHLFGSHALRVVLDSPCPVMIVQDGFPEQGYQHVVMPVNNDADPHQMTEWVLLLWELFNAEIHLFQSLETNSDRSHLIKGITSQITGVFNEKKVTYTFTQAESPNDFSSQVIAFANTNRSDLVITMTMPASDTTGYNFLDWHERLMFNPGRIPVMFLDRTDPAG
jgi:nucleotide-binding universal stress UspA family protein